MCLLLWWLLYVRVPAEVRVFGWHNTQKGETQTLYRRIYNTSQIYIWFTVLCRIVTIRLILSIDFRIIVLQTTKLFGIWSIKLKIIPMWCVWMLYGGNSQCEISYKFYPKVLFFKFATIYEFYLNNNNQLGVSQIQSFHIFSIFFLNLFTKKNERLAAISNVCYTVRPVATLSILSKSKLQLRRAENAQYSIKYMLVFIIYLYSVYFICSTQF